MRGFPDRGRSHAGQASLLWDGRITDHHKTDYLSSLRRHDDIGKVWELRPKRIVIGAVSLTVVRYAGLELRAVLDRLRG